MLSWRENGEWIMEYENGEGKEESNRTLNIGMEGESELPDG